MLSTVYDGVYHTPGDNISASEKLITRCVILRGCDIQRIPVMEWVVISGF